MRGIQLNKRTRVIVVRLVIHVVKVLEGNSAKRKIRGLEGNSAEQTIREASGYFDHIKNEGAWGEFS